MWGGGGGQWEADTWRRGSGRTRPARQILSGGGGSRVRGERIREFGMGGVYIGIEGSRRAQMRCGFRL